MNKIMTKSLDELQVGTHAIIEKITAPAELKSRLLSLGFIRGNQIRVASVSMAKETYVVNVGEKSQYALRNIEAQHIIVWQILSVNARKF